ncbi:metal-sulfur cluster assembly factor [Ectobacillus polymachus]|uniref:metal-sulfur cluster assembly factor n=1 Tax=Ectobacillus polymachus TaxID=1508806 RepID=UPI003A8A95C1
MNNLEQEIYDVLEHVKDPELGMDIINLGLVYDVDISSENNVTITMTLTSIGCPLGGEIVSSVKMAASSIQGVHEVAVNIVFNPPWTTDRMTRLAKIALGVRD